MLVLSRKALQSVKVRVDRKALLDHLAAEAGGLELEISVVAFRSGGRVRLGFKAPPCVDVIREELSKNAA